MNKRTGRYRRWRNRIPRIRSSNRTLCKPEGYIPWRTPPCCKGGSLLFWFLYGLRSPFRLFWNRTVRHDKVKLQTDKAVSTTGSSRLRTYARLETVPENVIVYLDTEDHFEIHRSLLPREKLSPLSNGFQFFTRSEIRSTPPRAFREKLGPLISCPIHGSPNNFL